MSDTVINYYHAWLEYYAGKVSSDAIIIVSLIIYGLVFICLFAYKFASYDCDVLFASKAAISYLSSPENKRSGSLNYYMRSFPREIYSRWEKFYSTKLGKPSDYLSTELSYSHGILESGFLGAMKLLVTFGTIVNLAFALSKHAALGEKAFLMPVITLAAGLSLLHAAELLFTITKRRSLVKFRECISCLDKYAAEDRIKNAVVVTEKREPTQSLKDSLEKALSKEPLEVYSSNNEPC